MKRSMSLISYIGSFTVAMAIAFPSFAVSQDAATESTMPDL
jgi:hypothetical protein